MLHKFPYHGGAEFLQELSQIAAFIDGNKKKHSFVATTETEKLFSIRLPLFYPSPMDGERLWQYLERIEVPSEIPPWNILVMETGRAALASCVEGQITSHKNIRKYMVRKKQGKSQLKYLNTKGKSRYGSRLRLREGEAFFDEIIEKLQDPEYREAPFVFAHIPTSLQSHLKKAGEALKFSFDQFQWRSFGIDIPEASFAQSQRLAMEGAYFRLEILSESTIENFPSIPKYQKL